MKITREIIDNGQKIIHINYTDEEIKTIQQKYKERQKELENLKKQQDGQQS